MHKPDFGQIVGAAVIAALITLAVVGCVRAWPVGVLVVIFGALIILTFLVMSRDRIRRAVFTLTKDGLTVDTTLADPVREELHSTGIEGAAAIYAFIHNQLADDPQTHQVKVQLQDDVVRLVQDNAFEHPVTANQITDIVQNGAPAARVLAFGLMATDSTFATAPLLLRGISESRSGNEQYWALRAARAAWTQLSSEERAQIRQAVQVAPYINDDPDRREEARRISQLPD